MRQPPWGDLARRLGLIGARLIEDSDRTDTSDTSTPPQVSSAEPARPASPDDSTEAMSDELTEIFTRDPAPTEPDDSPAVRAWRERVTPLVLDVAAKYGVLERPRR